MAAADDQPDDAAARRSARADLWKIVNAPFFLFLCSSVAVAVIGNLYSQMIADRTAIEARRDPLFKQLIEFEYRITRLERDEYDLLDLTADDAPRMAEIGRDIIGVVRGDGEAATSTPEFKSVYLGVIADQIDLTAGLPGNHQLSPRIEALSVDACEAARDLHGTLNYFRAWLRLRRDGVDLGYLPKLPRTVLPPDQQQALVMPSDDALGKADTDPAFARNSAMLRDLTGKCQSL